MNRDNKLFLSVLTFILLIVLVGCMSTNLGDSSMPGETLPAQGNLNPDNQSSAVGEETQITSYAMMPAPVLGVVLDQDGKVLFVKSGSAAEKAGVAVDDVLESVNGISISSDREKAHEVISSTADGELIDLQYNHGGRSITTKAQPSRPTPLLRADGTMTTPTPVLPPEDYL